MGGSVKRLRVCIFICIIIVVNILWHESKRQSNLRKHGLDFADAGQVFAGPTLTMEDAGADYDEQRFNTLGLLGVTVVCICHTETDDEIRVISMRKAETHEIEQLFSYL